MKKSLKKLKKEYDKQINFAKEYGYKGIMIPSIIEDEEILLEDHYPQEDIVELAYEHDWQEFMLVYFDTDDSSFISVE